jgi:heat shock protein HslJ
MRVRSILAAMAMAMALSVSCSSEGTASAGEPEGVRKGGVVAPEDVEARWRVTAVDGRPVEEERNAHLSFRPGRFGGSVGCNGFGAPGLLADGHYAISFWSSSAMACPGRLAGDQEQAVSELMFSRPKVERLSGEALRFSGGGHSMELSYLGPNDKAEDSKEPVDLTNTLWRAIMMNGREKAVDPTNRYIRFSANGWQAQIACATLNGTWRRDGDRLLIGEQIATTEQLCPADLAAIDASFVALMRTNPRYLAGEMGDLLIAGGGNALTAARR